MAKKSYVGASSIAREVKNGYIGVSGVARKIKKAYIGVDGVARLCWRGEKNIPLCFTANTAGSTVGMTVYGGATLTREINLEYSTDKNNWTAFVIGTTAITLPNIGDKVYFRGDNPNGINTVLDESVIMFTMSGSISASGNIMSIVDKTCESLIIPCEYCFAGLFAFCAGLTTPPALPATTLTTLCYSEMFAGCTSLTSAPVLPATTLSGWCYMGMFVSCTSLTTAPELPSTTMDYGCYQAMFEDCTALTTPPALLATILDTNCYKSMFSGCTSLQVSDTQTAEAPYAWTIPADGTFENTYSQSGMFTDCLGNRSSNNMAGAQGQSYTYYTQNQPL